MRILVRKQCRTGEALSAAFWALFYLFLIGVAVDAGKPGSASR
jgi:hypothetical protein